MARGTDSPSWSFRLLHGAGWVLIGVAVVGLLAEAPSGQLGSRIGGAALFGTTGAAAVAAARLAKRRSDWGRRLGMLATVGMLVIAWALTARPTGHLFSILFGVALLVVGSIVGWRLLRSRRPGRSSDQAEGGPDVT